MKKGWHSASPLIFLYFPSFRSALGELEAAASLALAVLLAFDRAAVAGEEAVGLQHATQFRLEIGHGLGDAVTQSARLAVQK